MFPKDMARARALSAFPDSYDRFFLEAIMQREKGNSDAAFDLLSYCVKINPKASESYYYLAQYYQALKDDEATMRCLEKAVALAPDNDTYMETLARAYASKGRIKEAAAMFECLYEVHHDRDDVLELLLQLYQSDNDYANAIRTLDRLEYFQGKSEELSYTKSDIYTRQGNNKAAIAEMKSLADQYPNDMNALTAYGDALLANDNRKKAYEIYQNILSNDSTNSRAQISLRAYYNLVGDKANVAKMTERVLTNKETSTAMRAYILRQEINESEKNGGDSTKILNLFGKILAMPQTDTDMALLCASYMNLKNMPSDTVEAVVAKALEIAPDNAGARLQLVSYAWQRNDTKRVEQLCEEAHEYNPEEMAFYYYQGIAYYKDEDNANALATFKKGVSVINAQSDPAIVSDFYAVMGDLMYQEGKQEEAFAAYDSCLQWKDDNIGCLNNYAYYLSELNRELPKAEQMSYRTIKSDPDNATYLDTYAWILFLQERYSEAKIYIDQALQNDTDSNAVIIEHAGDIYAKNGDTAKAVRLWTEALTKAPDNQLLERKVKQKKYIKKL